MIKLPLNFCIFTLGWTVFGSYFWVFFSFLFFKPPQICNAASFISKLLSPPPQLLLPLLVPLLQWRHSTPNTRFPFPGAAMHRTQPFASACLFSAQKELQLSLTCLLASSSCFVASCSSKPRASARPAISSCDCLTVSISRCLRGERAQTTTRYDISERACLGDDTLRLSRRASRTTFSCHILQLPRIQHQGLRSC